MLKIHTSKLDTKTKIVALLLENKNERFSIRKIAKNVGIDYKAVYQAIDFLRKKGTLTAEHNGNTIFCSISRALDEIIFSAESFRRNNIIKNKNIKVTADSIKNDIGTSLFVMLLFGSYAKGNNTKESDIDIMFIIGNKEIENKIEKAVHRLPLNIHPVILTENQFRNMAKSREFSVVQETIKNNIILHNIEGYYEMVK